MMEHKNLSDIKPMESYEAPKVPTLAQIYKNPEPLKKLPKRWVKNAAVVAGVGILGLSTLAGCLSRAPVYYPADGAFCMCSEYGGYQEFDLEIRLHWGGANLANYIVHLTEQEAFRIIRTQLEAVGVRLCDTPPDYTITTNPDEFALRWGHEPIDVELDLFDAHNRVAVVRQRGHYRSDELVAAFAQLTDINVGVIWIPSHNLNWRGWVQDDDGEWVEFEPTAEQEAEAKAAARPILEGSLNSQIQAFIALLRAEGVVE